MTTIAPGVNSYISLETAQEIAGEYLFAKSSDDENFAKALVTATRFLDRMHWRGSPVSAQQELQWPRRMHRPGDPVVASDTIPAPVARACVELAIHLTTLPGPSSAPVQMRQLGDGLAMYFPTVADELPKHVRRLLAPYLNVESAHVAEMIP